MLSSGTILHNRYRIEAPLGQGGMGAVYRAWDTNLELWMAVKENFDTSPPARRQFQQEASILARLSHPGLPRVTDHFFLRDQGQYLVMDFIEGPDLDILLQQHQVFSEKQALPWILQVCDALAYLHRQIPPIIHRDIKPANIKIRSDGQAMLVDFGIAKFYDSQLLTTQGAKAVTPGYSPPEQYANGRTDTRSDIYALGATLYHLLTGQIPPESLQRIVGNVTVPPPRQLNPRISPTTEQAIIKSIAITTSRRYQKVEAFQAALPQQSPVSYKPIQPEPDKQPSDNATPPPTTPKKEDNVGVIVGTVGTVIFLLLIFLFYRLTLPPSESDIATTTAVAQTTSDAPASATQTNTVVSTDDNAATPNAQLNLLSPTNDAVLEPDKGLSLSWAWPLAQGQQFKLIAQSNQGNSIERQLTENELKLTATELPPGSYTWLVLVEDASGKELARSGTGYFYIQSAPTATPLPTVIIATATLRPTSTPQPTVTSPALSAPQATATPSPTSPPPPGAPLPAPTLLGPDNNAAFTSRVAEITFQWQAAERALAENEYYILLIKHREGDDRTWLKETSYGLQANGKGWLYGLTDHQGALQWRVIIAQKQTDEPNEDPANYATSPPSETRTLTWREGSDDDDGEGGEPAPCPEGRC